MSVVMSNSPDPLGLKPRVPKNYSKMRRIIAEDPHWSLALVPYLSQLCMQTIVSNFEGNPIFEELQPTEKEYVHQKLPVSLPLKVTANIISDGEYWKRCCEQQWDFCDVSDYGYSWKQMFFERLMEGVVHLFVPDVTKVGTVVDTAMLCRNYVKRLNISQLLPPIMEPPREEEEPGVETASENEYQGPSMDHFNFGILLYELTNLEELRLVYRVKECGMNFDWNMFEMTDRDCVSLARALRSCKTLNILRLHQSFVEDKKCEVLVKHLLSHPSLRELDFSHNTIGDCGARAISKLLDRGRLQVLNMCDNEITDRGAEAIADALSKNSALWSLNLRLNCLTDEGGVAICEALLNNSSLRQLHLGANELTGCTAAALSKVLAQNDVLKSVNLSCNNLGEDGGKVLAEAMSHNTSVTECDIRLTEVDEETVSFINQVVCTNQSLELTKRYKEKKTPK